MQVGKTIIGYLFYGNFWIALCSVAAAEVLRTLYGFPFDPQALAIVYAATFLRYNVQAFRDRDPVSANRKYAFIHRHRLALRLLFVVHLCVGAWAAFGLSWERWALLAHLAALSMLYLAGLRKVPYLKVPLVAYVWACATLTLFLPYEEWLSQRALLAFAERALFYVALTLPFDLRDVQDDRLTGVRTLATALGPTASNAVALLALVGSGVLAWMAYPHGPALYALLAGTALAALVVAAGSPRRPELYFTGLVDGMILLQWALVTAADRFIP